MKVLTTPLLSSGHTVDRYSMEPDILERPQGDTSQAMVYVAVGKSPVKTLVLLQWAFRTFPNSPLGLVHVHQPSPFIPTLLGKLPATQANPEVVCNHRREEREKMKKFLHNYSKICLQAKVEASILFTEAEHVQRGLVDLVIKHKIQKLVMGCVSDNCRKLKRSSGKANYAVKYAPAFCEIWFIYKGMHVWTREALGAFTTSTDPGGNAYELSTGSKSLRYNKTECLYNPDDLHFNSSHLRMPCSGMIDCVENEHTEEDWLLPHGRCSSSDSHNNFHARSSTPSDPPAIASRILSDLDYKLEEESLSQELLEAKAESVNAKSQVFVELFKRNKLEAEAIEAIKKVKHIQCAHDHEAKTRREADDALRSMMQEQEKLLEERLEMTGELQKTMRNVAVLDSRLQEANRRCDEAAGELKLVQVSLASLRQEKLRLQKQKMEAELWLERWKKSQRQAVGTNPNGYPGFLNNVPELVEFSLFDLQNATCNFSASFKIAEGGFGCIYKGELLDRTVTIQRLPAHNIQGPSQFQKQVQILGKLRHPHLVNLIGACSEAWSLVYDYVPNGTLQCHLSNKNNTSPLSWKIRARIISEISTALLFLHTCHPVKIVHGDLKPENILLDSNLHCKICDFGISRQVSQETLSCPSFRRYPETQGAFPYTDPEYHRTGKLTPKSDVYALGIVILQLLTGQPPIGLVINVRKAVLAGKLSSVLDTSGGYWELSVAEKLGDIALRFCEQNSRDRPELTPSLVKELQQLHMSEERHVPSFFMCPILQEMMCHPQVAADGFTYEGGAIREWLENGRETSPMTNLRLDHLHLTPNHSLRLAIQEWLCRC